MMIIYIAASVNIPTELVEAKIDGATKVAGVQGIIPMVMSLRDDLPVSDSDQLLQALLTNSALTAGARPRNGQCYAGHLYDFHNRNGQGVARQRRVILL